MIQLSVDTYLFSNSLGRYLNWYRLLRTLVKRSNVDPTNIKYYGIPIVSFLGHGLAGIIDHIAGKIPLRDFPLYSIAKSLNVDVEHL